MHDNNPPPSKGPPLWGAVPANGVATARCRRGSAHLSRASAAMHGPGFFYAGQADLAWAGCVYLHRLTWEWQALQKRMHRASAKLTISSSLPRHCGGSVQHALLAAEDTLGFYQYRSAAEKSCS